MPEIKPVTIQIGRYCCTTDRATAKRIAADPARLLSLYEMMVEAALVSEARPLRQIKKLKE